jgi:SAM-dependent methyltransferase
MNVSDLRQHSGACARNRQPILEVLRRVLPENVRVLEIGSGTGEHGAFFASEQPSWSWQPSDLSPAALESTGAWVEYMGLSNLAMPVALDVTASTWPVEQADALFCANMIHISPWACTLGLLDGASRVLAAGGRLVTYGPYKMGGVHTAPSNASFDQSLRFRDPSWGLRDFEEITVAAGTRGLVHSETQPMPANNFCLVFEREA